MNDYEKYEAACKKIRRANQKLLTDFESWLKKSSGLSEKTIKNHLANISLFCQRRRVRIEIKALKARGGLWLSHVPSKKRSR